MKTIRKYGYLLISTLILVMLFGTQCVFADTVYQAVNPYAELQYVLDGEEEQEDNGELFWVYESLETSEEEEKPVLFDYIETEKLTGWVKQAGIWYYYKDGKKLSNSWLLYNDEWYWFGADGAMSENEFITVRGELYATGCYGAIYQSEWFIEDGTEYYAGSSGALCRSTLNWNGVTYHFDSATGALTSVDPYWYLLDGRYRYVKSDQSDAANEWLLYSGCWYYFDEEGWMMSSTFFTEKGNLYYARSWGGIYTNQFFTVDGKTYCARNWGGLYTDGVYSIQGKNYAFDENGVVVQANAFEKRENGDWVYRKSDGHLAANEWIYYKNNWYYFDENHIMYADSAFQAADGKYYYAKSWGGIYMNSWIQAGENTCYAGSSGALATNWLKVNNVWYFANADENNGQIGRILKDELTIWKDVRYYLSSTGAMVTGWKTIGEDTYYFQSWGGAYQDTTVKIGTQYYAFDEEGRLIKNTYEANSDDGQYLVTDAILGYQTIENFLRCALMPVGRTLYVYAGGHSQSELGMSGVNPNWAAYFQANDETYNPDAHEYEYGNGLDCSGYVGWAVYQVMQEVCTTVSTKTPSNLANHGWGTVTTNSSGKFYPGDVVSRSGHTWIIVGQCDDGSVVLMHASSEYVQISGTVNSSGSANSEAIALAETYMARYYPVAYARYGNAHSGSNYLSSSLNVFRFSESIMTDAKYMQSLSAKDVLKLMFHEN